MFMVEVCLDSFFRAFFGLNKEIKEEDLKVKIAKKMVKVNQIQRLMVLILTRMNFFLFSLIQNVACERIVVCQIKALILVMIRQIDEDEQQS